MICDIVIIAFEITTDVIPSSMDILCLFNKYAFSGSPAKLADGIIIFIDSPASRMVNRFLKYTFAPFNEYFHPRVSSAKTIA